MDRKIVTETLKELINSSADENGWMNLANLGFELTKNGIDYKKLGFYKLTNFISSYTDILDVRKDDTHKLPVHYVKLKKNPSKKSVSTLIDKNISPKNALTNWAYLNHYQTTIEKLKTLALDERWFYKEQDPDFPYPILTSYLHYTFYKLSREENRILVSENYSAFNTGLVDNRYESIYALFEKNNTYTQPWKLVEFVYQEKVLRGNTWLETLKINQEERIISVMLRICYTILKQEN